VNLDRQITAGKILKIEPFTLYTLVICESLKDGKTYRTHLRIGTTNYRLQIGDLLSWSSFYDGTGSRALWWVPNNSDPQPKLLHLECVESRVSF
jgi:hypothetical protein